MKKQAVFAAVLLAFLFLLHGCGKAVTVGPFSSLYFSENDYESAVQEVMTAFKSYEGCTMNRIDYAGDDAVNEEASLRGLAPECVMVLTCTFTTDGDDHGTVFEPNQTYKDYKWTLTRSTPDDPVWMILDRGYC